MAEESQSQEEVILTIKTGTLHQHPLENESIYSKIQNSNETPTEVIEFDLKELNAIHGVVAEVDLIDYDVNDNDDVGDNDNDHNEAIDPLESEDCDEESSRSRSISKKVAELDKSKKIWLVESYCLHKNTGLVIKEWKNEFPGIKPPHRSTILRLLKKFKDYGSIERKKYIRKNPVRTEANIARVKEYFDANPNISTRKAAPILDIERTTLRRVLSDLKKSKSSANRSTNKKRKRSTKSSKATPASLPPPQPLPIHPPNNTAVVNLSPSSSTFQSTPAVAISLSLPPL